MASSIAKFTDPVHTADGSDRAVAPFAGLETLWFNTGSLCNLTCDHCYMESSPTNDALVYLTRDEVASYVGEALALSRPPLTIGFTGGEPFMNPEMIDILEDVLSRGIRALVLSNAMKPLRRRENDLKRFEAAFPGQLTIRVSLDHHTQAGHDQERGAGGFTETLAGMAWLSAAGIRVHCAGRSLQGEDAISVRSAYMALFNSNAVELTDDSDALVIFPEMDASDLSPPEITTSCWDILSKEPTSVMCANSRMVLKRRGATSPSVARCTLLPYDEFFDSGASLTDSFQPTPLKHVYCAQFCVLGGASCS